MAQSDLRMLSQDRWPRDAPPVFFFVIRLVRRRSTDELVLETAGEMADGFDVMAIGIEDERGVVIRVILGAL